MPNRKKKKTERKTNYVGMRISEKQKYRLGQLAQVRGMTLSQVLEEAVEGLLTDPKWERNRCFAFIAAAAAIIESEENGGDEHEKIKI